MSTPDLRLGVPLGPFTTFGIGGRASLFVDARSSSELAAALTWGREQGLPTPVLGRGSNVLVGDGGFDGLVVRNATARGVEVVDDAYIRAESGVEIERLIDLTVARGLSGLEHFAGVPSTLGGALWQNLHFLTPDRKHVAYMGDLVEEATVLEGGSISTVSREWFAFGYDESALRRRDAVVLGATLRLTPAEPSLLRARVGANLAWRRERHPAAAAIRSAGCLFRNPAGSSAARAIDAAGLKRRRIGGAVVSSRHANFVLNLGGASAADVLELMALIGDRVAAHSGLRLEPEIQLIGCAR